MQAYSQPLIKLQVEATRFIRDRSIRLLHVIADVRLHEAAVEILAALEYRAVNRSPFVILQEPHERNDPGWERRVLTARQQHEHRRTQMAERGERLGQLPAPPATQGLVGLAEQLGQLLHVRPDDTDGLVVVLAPSYVEMPKTWQQALGMLLSLRGLAEVRFVIVDRERSSLGPLAARYEEQMLSVACRVEGESPTAILAEALDPSILSFDGPLGARPKGVLPPRRLNDPPPEAADPQAIRTLDTSRSALLASVAVQEGRMPDAIAHQRRARDASMDAGQIEQGVMMELVLGGYLLTAGAVAQAERSYERAGVGAEAAALTDKAAMARLALGSSQLVRNDRTGALVEYAQAASLAEQSGHAALALHACRLTGDVARTLRMDAQAIAFWAKAIEIAERDPATAPLTSAGLVALQLALLCRERGQHEQATVFLSKADVLVRLEPEPLQPSTEVVPRAQEVLQQEAAPSLHAPPATIEGTEQLTWADIAAFHDAPAPPRRQDDAVAADPVAAEQLREWSTIEQDTLRSTTTQLLGIESTTLLSQAELAALRGDVDLPPARVASDTEEATLRLDPEQLQRLRGQPAAAPVVTGEGTELYTPDMIRALKAAWAEADASDDPEPGGEER